MAKIQLNAVTISVPVANAPNVSSLTQAGTSASLVGALSAHDDNLNNTLVKMSAQGWDLQTVLYVPPGPIPAHFQMFFIKQ